MHQIRNHLQNLLDLLFPHLCVLCKRGGGILCLQCLKSIQPFHSPLCPHCGTQLFPSTPCRNCLCRKINLNMVRAFGNYDASLRLCIQALKYDGQTRLAEPLGKLLAEAYKAHKLQADFLVPVPLHKEREKKRGYNQTVLLARECAKVIGVPLREDILVRTRATSAQVGLNVRERQQNVGGAFSCRSSFTTRELSGRTILMIDDVCTTGSTLEACAIPLFAAGAGRVSGLVLARPV